MGEARAAEAHRRVRVLSRKVTEEVGEVCGRRGAAEHPARR